MTAGASESAGIMKVFSRVIPSQFTFTFMTVKTFVENDRVVMLLGIAAALSAAFLLPTSVVKGLLNRVLLFFTCLAFICIIQIETATDVVSYFISTADNIANYIRFAAAIVIILNIFIFGVNSDSSKSSDAGSDSQGSNKDAGKILVPNG